jgi:general secretion pathway protein G
MTRIPSGSADGGELRCQPSSPGRTRIGVVSSTLPNLVGASRRAQPQSALKPQAEVLGLGKPNRKGFTVIELIVAMTILMILTAAAVPIVRVTIQRNKERELRRDLWEMRDAIDRYKDAADRGAFQIKVDSQGYPPDLDTLVKGVDSNGKKLRFLRRIPDDPMTGKTEWGLRSMQDDPDSDSWGGQNVFDVYTKSEGTALDGSKYKTW